MKAIILTPGVKSSRSFDLVSHLSQGAVVVLTNSMHQDSLVRPCKFSGPIIDGETLLDPSRLNEMNELAKRLARNWLFEKEIEEKLIYRGVNLGSLYTRTLLYLFLGVLKALMCFDRIVEKFNPDAIHLISDGSYWSHAAIEVCRVRNIPLSIVDAVSTKEKKTNPFWFREFLRTVLERLNQKAWRNPSQGNILYSASLRYALPMLKETSGSYFLREIFSYQAHRLAKRHNFLHAVPNYFSRSELPKQSFSASDLFKYVDDFFSRRAFFEFCPYSVWAVVRMEFQQMIECEFRKGIVLINAFFRMLDQLKPSGIVVDEDVCPFNKTLILCGNHYGIPTFTLTHGVPYFDVGSLPLSANRVLVWGPSSRTRLQKWGIPEERILEIGAPQYCEFSKLDRKFARRNVEQTFGIASQQKILLIVTQPFHTNEYPDYFDSPLTSDLVDKTLQLVERFLESNKDVVAVIKFHPGERNIWYTETLLQNFSKSIQSRIKMVKDYDTPALIAASDLVLTGGSTVYFEALLLKKPVFLLDYKNERRFGFMADEYLNLNDIECAARELAVYCSDKIKTTAKINRQEQEISSHFTLPVEDSSARLLELLNRGGCKLSRSGFISHRK